MRTLALTDSKINLYAGTYLNAWPMHNIFGITMKPVKVLFIPADKNPLSIILSASCCVYLCAVSSSSALLPQAPCCLRQFSRTAFSRRHICWQMNQQATTLRASPTKTTSFSDRSISFHDIHISPSTSWEEIEFDVNPKVGCIFINFFVT